MRLSLSQISDPNLLSQFKDIANISGPCELELTDGTVTLPIRHAIVHLIYWQNLIAFNLPIKKKHVVFDSGVCSQETISKFQTICFNDIIAKYPDKETEIVKRLFDTINLNNQFILTNLTEYHSSLDIFGLSHLMRDEQIKQTTNVKLDPLMGTDVIERTISEANEEFCQLIGKRGLVKNNVLLPFMEAKLLNKNQLMQMFIALGVRTDINDMVVTYPITASVFEGMNNSWQYVVESLSSKKAKFYNVIAVRDSQYLNRKQQLLSFVIERIYKGSCGTNTTMTYHITPTNYKHLAGKIIKNDDGTETILTKETLPQYINKTVHMFSPITCKYTDGYCEHCGGMLTKFLPKELNKGIMSSTIVIKDITQLILSSKHFVKTNSIIYKIPTEGVPYFRRNNNEIYWRKNIAKELDKITLGFFIRDICPINDLTLMDFNSDINEEKFSHLTYMVIRKEGIDDIEIPLVSIADKTTPHLSVEMLSHMKNNINDVKQDDLMMWIPLKGMSGDVPIFRSVIANNSMMLYMKEAAGFLQTNINKYTSANQALKDFTDIVYSKVSMNILHIETMLKAYLVTSQFNYDIPVVTDPDNVLFQTNPRIVKNRTVSGELAFQCLMQYFSYPGTFVIPRSPCIFDPFFAI